MRITRIATATAVATLVIAALTACSSSPESAATDIVVGAGGQLSNTDLFAAVQDGTFKDQGLTVTTEPLTAGSNAIPQLISGDLTFAAVDTTTAINATMQKVGITAVATNTVGVPDDTGYGMVVAGADSGIESPKDLVGKKVQVNAIGGTAHVLTKASVEIDGGDPSKVEFVEIAPPQALPALQADQVDAAVLSEPNVTAAKALGFAAVFNPEQKTVPDLPTFVFVTSTAFAQKNPEVVTKFQGAILAANRALNADPDVVRETAKTSTEVPEDVLAQVEGLPLFGQEQLAGQQVQDYIDVLVKYGALDAAGVPSGEEVVWKP